MPGDTPDDTDSTKDSNTTDQDHSGADLPLRRRTVLKGALASSIAAGGFSAVTDEVAAQSSDQDWPQFQFDTANTGHNPDGTGPTTGVGSQWNPFTTGGRVTSPVVADGTVYAGSGDGTLYAVDATSGDEQWSFSTGGTVKTPAVTSDTVYIGSQGGHVYALNASDGTKQWEWPFPKGGASGAPTVANGTVFAPGADDRFFALNADDGSELWSVFTEECAGGQVRTPAVADGAVYITEDCGKTWALNASDGTVQWKFDDGSFRGQGSAPTVADGTVYFGTLKAGSPEGNKLFAVDAATGTEQWRFTFTPEGDVNSSPAIANGTVFFGSDNGTVYALDASDGTKVWEFATGGAVTSSPAVVSGVVYIASDDGNLYLIDASSGDEIDQFSTGGEPGSSPAVANGNVYVGSRDGNLYGLEEGDGDGAANTPPTAAFDFTPEDPVVGEEVTFDPSASSDPDGSISTYGWDFDGDDTFDKTRFSDETVTHTYTEAGDFSVTLKVTDDDGAEDKVTRTVSVSKIDIRVKNVRLVQTVENSRVPGVKAEVEDPDLVTGRKTTVLFDLDGDSAEIDEFLDEDVDFEVRKEFDNKSSTSVSSFSIKSEWINDIISRGDIIETASTIGGDFNGLFVDGNIPVFDSSLNNLETVTVDFAPNSKKIDGNSITRIQGDDFEINESRELRVGFIPVKDPSGGLSFGSNGNGGAKSYIESVDEIIDYLERTYPTDAVIPYRHDINDPISGVLSTALSPVTPFPNLVSIGFDMLDAREKLDEQLPISAKNNPVGGEIDLFDVTVAIVPDRYFSHHNFSDKLGVHIATDRNHPQVSAAVLENSALNNAHSGEIGAHEIGHHFVNNPYGNDLAQPGDNDHARGTLVSTKFDWVTDSSLHIEDAVQSYMVNQGSDLWSDERIHQLLIDSLFQPDPLESPTDKFDILLLNGATWFNEEDEADLIRVGKKKGKPMRSIEDGEVVISSINPSGDVLDKRIFPNYTTVAFDNGESHEKVQNFVMFTIPFPEKTSKVEFDNEGTKTIINPIEKTVHDAVADIPEEGFITSPDERRQSLFNKLVAIDKQMEQEKFQAAKRKMKRDVRDKLEKWLKDDYDTAANQPTKQEMLDLVDDMIERLETLRQTSNRGRN